MLKMSTFAGKIMAFSFISRTELVKGSILKLIEFVGFLTNGMASLEYVNEWTKGTFKNSDTCRNSLARATISSVVD